MDGSGRIGKVGRQAAPGRGASAARAAIMAAALAALAACSSGPTDFADLSGLTGWNDAPTEVRSEAQKTALERDLTSTANRVQSAGDAAERIQPGALALAVVRQQQNEEARALLEEAGVNDGPPCLSTPTRTCPADQD